MRDLVVGIDHPTSGDRVWVQGHAAPRHAPDGTLVGVIGTFTDITALKQAEQVALLQARLLDVVGQAVIVTDLVGIVQYWNQAAETLYGWSAAEALGRNVMLITPPEASAGQAEAIMEELRAGRKWSGEFPLQRRDGSTFPALVTDSPIVDEGGVLTGIIGISSDLSTLKHAQEALGASEARFRALSEHATDLVAVLTVDGIFTYASPSYLLVLGYAPQEVVGRRILTAVHPDDVAGLQQVWTRLLSSGYRSLCGVSATASGWRLAHRGDDRGKLSRGPRGTRDPCHNPRHHRTAAGRGGAAGQ